MQHEPEAELLLGVKFSTHGSKTDAAAARRLAANDYLGVQISLDGVTADVNDAVHGSGSYTTAVRATGHLADAGMTGRRRARCRTGRVGVRRVAAAFAVAGTGPGTWSLDDTLNIELAGTGLGAGRARRWPARWCRRGERPPTHRSAGADRGQSESTSAA